MINWAKDFTLTLNFANSFSITALTVGIIDCFSKFDLFFLCELYNITSLRCLRFMVNITMIVLVALWVMYWNDLLRGNLKDLLSRRNVNSKFHWLFRRLDYILRAEIRSLEALYSTTHRWKASHFAFSKRVLVLWTLCLRSSCILKCSYYGSLLSPSWYS